MADDDRETDDSLEEGLSRAAGKLDGAGGASDDDEPDDVDDPDDEPDDPDEDVPDDDEEDPEDPDEEEDPDDPDDDDDPDDEDPDDLDDDPEEEEDPEDDDALDPEVEAAAARHQLPTNFEDIVRKLPKAARADARQAFRQRLKEVESGLGRAFQEARAERKELARLKAERKHEEEHRADYLADLIDADPKLLEQLNEELEKRETAAYREAKKLTREQAKKELDSTAERETAQLEQRRQRGQQVASLAQRLAREAGVPFKIVDKTLYIAVLNSPEKDVTDEAIRRIVKQEARDWRKLTGERKTEKKQENIKDKSQ